ncbi:MAG: hypothetical protein Greene071436_19, partial [Parcubacteria group bacterium Greene0714_36]
IGAGDFDAAEKVSRKKEREICDAEITSIAHAIEALSATDSKSRSTKKVLDKQLAEKKKSCIF